MAITLADAAVNTQDDVDFTVIDEFRRQSVLLDRLAFDDCVNPAGGGATLTYGYTRLTQVPSSAFRAINSEYTESQAKRTRQTVDLKPLGGKFPIDRVLANLGPAATNEVAFQLGQQVKSTIAKFQDEVINGDEAVDANGFDGLDKALTGTATELGTGTSVASGLDWTSFASNSDLWAAIEWLDNLVGQITGGADMLMGNTKSMAKIKMIAGQAGYYSRDKNDFGQFVERYGNVILQDLGYNVSSGANPVETSVVPIETRQLDGSTNTTGLTDIYAVRFGLDAFHAVSVSGSRLVKTWLPDFSTSGAVKDGEAEMGPTATVLKNTRGAAVLRNVKVQ